MSEQESSDTIELTSFTGTEVGYFFICRKKLWWFHNGVEMERENERVQIGKIVHENAYARKKKEITIDGKIVLDWQEDGVIHEVKLSNKMESAHEFQLLYYIYFLKQKGVENLTGQIDYPKLRQTQTLVLTEEKETELIETLRAMRRITEQKRAPPVEYMKICNSCAYAELCWG
jgi:CRISPR-associated exonuclease Cas4